MPHSISRHPRWLCALLLPAIVAAPAADVLARADPWTRVTLLAQGSYITVADYSGNATTGPLLVADDEALVVLEAPPGRRTRRILRPEVQFVLHWRSPPHAARTRILGAALLAGAGALTVRSAQSGRWSALRLVSFSALYGALANTSRPRPPAPIEVYRGEPRNHAPHCWAVVVGGRFSIVRMSL